MGIEQKPWGTKTLLSQTPFFSIYLLEMNQNTRTSLHYHKYTTKSHYIVEGEIEVEIESGKLILTKGKELTIYPHKLHRLTAKTKSIFIEIATPEIFGEDTIRIEDDYGRKNDKL